MSPGNYDKTKTPEPKRRAVKGTKSGAGKVSVYFDSATESAWKFLEGRVQRQGLLTSAIQAKARELGWTPPEADEQDDATK